MFNVPVSTGRITCSLQTKRKKLKKILNANVILASVLKRIVFSETSI